MSLLKLLLVLQSLWAYQLIQKSHNPVVEMNGEQLAKVSTEEGEIKFKEKEIQYDLFEQSILQFSEDNLSLIDGIVRLRSSSMDRFKIATPVAMITLSGSDFIIRYERSKATATVVALNGSCLLQGHFHEELINIQAGEEGRFVGVPESDGPAFDVLLKGRKSVRGSLQGPEKLADAKRGEWDTTYDIKVKPIIAKPKPKPKPGQICVEPFAKFNECVWRCRNNPQGKASCQIDLAKVICERERCLANGKWGDQRNLKGSAKKQCTSSQDVVGECAY